MRNTTFKLQATEFFLDSLRALGEGREHLNARFQADVLVDVFLYEAMSAVDSLLQDINRELKLGLDAKDVRLKAIIDKIRVKTSKGAIKLTMTDMCDLNDLYTAGHWLSDLRELRNHSVHQRLLSRAITFDLPDDIVEVYLEKPWIPNGRTKKPVIPYLEEQLGKLKALVTDVRGKLKLP